MIAEQIKQSINAALAALTLPSADFVLEHPSDLTNGDYAANVALVLAKTENKNPRELAEQIANHINQQKLAWLAEVQVAGPGFLNFHLSDEFLVGSLAEIMEQGENYGQSEHAQGLKTIVEYTDPNPFKEFHIGHLMSNTIGEAISRVIAANGAEVKRACYQGDVGMHVAKAIYGLQNSKSLKEAYAFGAQVFETDELVKQAIQDLNKKIYDRRDEAVNKLYDTGREESLAAFEQIYQKLGTKFDFYFFESESGQFGKQVVLANENIFKAGEKGAVVYEGELDGLHTRVFINGEGLPTYEAKELGLAKIKYDKYPYDYSVVITGNEIKDYFRVILAAMKKVFPALAAKTHHVTHGMLRLPSGKMSSRTGEVITAESLIGEVKTKIKNKLAESEKGGELDEEILEQVAIGAIKYSILKQDSSHDIIFDLDKSISFEGNSGPYLQYTFARTQSVLAKAKEEGIKPTVAAPEAPRELERLLYRYPEVVARAGEHLAPHLLATYLTELAGAFNAYYASNQIVSEKGEAAYRVALTGAVGQVLKNGLHLLAIAAPAKM